MGEGNRFFFPDAFSHWGKDFNYFQFQQAKNNARRANFWPRNWPFLPIWYTFWSFWGSRKLFSAHIQSSLRIFGKCLYIVLSQVYFCVYFLHERLINNPENWILKIYPFWRFRWLIFELFGSKKVVFGIFSKLFRICLGDVWVLF